MIKTKLSGVLIWGLQCEEYELNKLFEGVSKYESPHSFLLMFSTSL